MNAYTGTDNLEAMSFARKYNRYLVELIKSAVAGRNPVSVLDFGAGIGTFTNLLKDPFKEIACVEPDPAQANILAENGWTTYLDITEVADCSTDFIYTLNVLEHIEDHEQCIKQLSRKLKPGGRIFIFVPAFQCLFSAMDRKVGHYRRYSSDQLYNLLRTAGLDVHTLKYCDSLGFLASFVYKYIGSDTGDITPRAVWIYDSFVFPLSRVLDIVLSRLIGKNVYAVAERPMSG